MKALVGDRVAPYAKAWLAFLGFVLVTIAVTFPAVPDWVAPVGSLLAAAAVWRVPNSSSDAPG